MSKTIENVESELKLLHEIEKISDVDEIFKLQEMSKNLNDIISMKLKNIKGKVSKEAYDYLFGEVVENNDTINDKTANSNSMYCQVIKEIFVNGKNMRMAIKEIYGDDSIKTLEKAVKNVIWSGQKNELIEVVKAASFSGGLFVEGKIVLTDKGKSLIC